MENKTYTEWKNPEIKKVIIDAIIDIFRKQYELVLRRWLKMVIGDWEKERRKKEENSNENGRSAKNYK